MIRFTAEQLRELDAAAGKPVEATAGPDGRRYLIVEAAVFERWDGVVPHQEYERLRHAAARQGMTAAARALRDMEEQDRSADAS